MRDATEGAGGLAAAGACDHAAMAEWTDPEVAAATMRRAQLEPLEPFDDADKAWRCRCLACGRVVTPRLSSISAGSGCKYCATRGLDLNAPAVVFVLTHEELHAHMVGFDAADGDTIEQREAAGWTVVKSASVPTVEDAYEIEAAVLRWLRLGLELPAVPTEGDAPQEAASVRADDIEASELWSQVSSELSRRRRRRRAAGGARGGQ